MGKRPVAQSKPDPSALFRMSFDVLDSIMYHVLLADRFVASAPMCLLEPSLLSLMLLLPKESSFWTSRVFGFWVVKSLNLLLLGELHRYAVVVAYYRSRVMCLQSSTPRAKQYCR
jgi:hypothetical protein